MNIIQKVWLLFLDHFSLMGDWIVEFGLPKEQECSFLELCETWRACMVICVLIYITLNRLPVLPEKKLCRCLSHFDTDKKEIIPSLAVDITLTLTVTPGPNHLATSHSWQLRCTAPYLTHQPLLHNIRTARRTTLHNVKIMYCNIWKTTKELLSRHYAAYFEVIFCTTRCTWLNYV